MKLEGRVAIVTGAGRNIGEAVAERLASEGAAIAVVDINPTTAQQVVDKIKAAGGKAAAFKCDVAHEADIKSTVMRGSQDVRQNRYSGQQRGDCRQ